jgi:hypothetical protein
MGEISIYFRCWLDVAMKSKALIFAITSIVLLSLTVIALVQNFGIGGWSYTKSERHYDGRFFRMVVKLDYHGEPQVFDFVVGCNVHSVLYKDNSSSRDVGLIPAVYGRRMKDGKGVVIRPPDVCNGETTASGQVPPAFMPLIVVYDNADTLDQGLAYLSDDAYDSPLSDMKFGSAEIIASTRAEFDADGEKGVPNLFTREKYWSAQPDDVVSSLGIKTIRPQYSKTCSYAERFRLPERIRQRASLVWPIGKPKYWYFKDFKEQEATFDEFLGNESKKPINFIQTEAGEAPINFYSFRRFLNPDVGLPRRTNKYLISEPLFSEDSGKLGPIMSYYPVRSAFMQSNWPDDITKWTAFIAGLSDPAVQIVDTQSGKLRGFASCWSFRSDHLQQENQVKIVALVKGHTEVDGERENSQTTQVQSAFSNPSILMERDEFVYQFKNFDFGIMGGDVR